MVAWLFSLVALLGAKLTARRAWLGGLLLGATLATSLKTVLMIPALALGVAVTLGLRRRGWRRSLITSEVLAWFRRLREVVDQLRS